jgi:two-component system nitrogen regulation sensor histidine kinase NtrY
MREPSTESATASAADRAEAELALTRGEKRKRRRERAAIGFLAVLFALLTFAEFKLGKLSSTLPFVNSIFFFGLLNVNIILLIAIVWLVSRNVGKLFIERRNRVLGARLKTKLVIVFLSFSLIPTLVLFLISALYINSSFDKWFSIKIQNTLQASLELTRTYYKNSEQTAMHFAEHLAGRLSDLLEERPDWESPAPRLARGGSGGGGGRGSRNPLVAWLESQRELLALDGIEYYTDPLEERFAVQRGPVPELGIPYPRVPLELLDRAFAGEAVSTIQHFGSGDLIRCLVPVRLGARGAPRVGPPEGGVHGAVVVSTYVPVSLVNKVDEIASVFDDYKVTNPLKYPMKTTYLVILVMITLVIAFVAIWMGLFLARELTVPIEGLVRGAKAVGAGNLDVTLHSSARDEIAVLVDSFNRMTRDLRENRHRLTQASADLEKRRLQLEAVLANVGTGVIVVGRDGEITTFNKAVSELLAIRPADALGRHYAELLEADAAPVAALIRRALESDLEPVVEQWNLSRDGNTKTLSAIATPVRDSEGSRPWGAVAAIDDMTFLVKGQREMAWREVARRIAHEIKNPLTPIKLSAQRLQRRLGALEGREGELLRECTETIVKHTDELKELVNEFSSFARLPEISPAVHDLNQAIAEVVALYRQAHTELEIELQADNGLPAFEFDRDQLKRVVINLMDNAVAATRSPPAGSVPRIAVRSRHRPELQLAIVTVQDNGTGMSEEVKARLFEPYFSTKSEGTGLGLAIAKRIVNDHDGVIRVQSEPGEGALFTIELPCRPVNQRV